MMNVKVLVERLCDGSYRAYMPDDNGLEYDIKGEGKTPEEAILDFRVAYQCIEDYYTTEGERFTPIESFYFEVKDRG